MDTDRLVGRGAVLAVLSGAFAAQAERSDPLLLVGEPGIGKTTCLSVVAAMAREAGHLLLQTAGHQDEAALPFAGLHRLLRPLLGATGDLPDVQRRALLGAFGMHDGGRSELFVVSVATASLLQHHYERRPLVITADDIEWLDDQTRHVLDFVARRIERHVVVVATSSSAASGSPFREVTLDRLDDRSARLLLADRAPGLDSTQRAWVMSHAVGNPLALIELAGLAIAGPATDPLTASVSLSPTLERAFAGGVHELSTTDRDAVLVAAVASDASLPEILAATARMSGHGVTPAVLESAQTLGLLRFDEIRVTFAHPLVKAAIVQREPISRRQAAHRALGAVITVNSHRRAWHRALGTATYDDEIADDLEATTDDSIRRGDIEAAIRALERAAQLSTNPVNRGRRLVLAARHAARLGQATQVLRLLEVADSSELSAFDRARSELLREDVGGSVVADSNRVVELCSVARRAAVAGETDLALDLAYAAGRRRCEAPVNVRAVSEVTAVAGRLIRESSDARAVAVLALADPVGHGRAVRSMLAEIEEDTVIDGDALSAYAVAARVVGDHVGASKLLDRAELDLRGRGLRGQLARNLCIAADLRLDLGDWERATTALAEFDAWAAASMSPNHRAAALMTTAKAAALRGDIPAALDLVFDMEQAPIARRGSSFLARAQIVRGIACLSAGKHLDAYTVLSRVFDPDDATHHVFEKLGAVTYLAEAAVHTGQQAQARVVVEGLRLIADASGSPALTTQLVYATAVLAPDDTAERRFLDGLASDATNAPWPRARLQLSYGRWLRRQLRVTQSRVPLQASLAVFERLGATRWAEEALDELNASGAPDNRPVEAARALLSAQESKIARLAARGLSNKEIGQQLYISPRTVGSHLYRIFPKLGISTRSQLASRLESASPT